MRIKTVIELTIIAAFAVAQAGQARARPHSQTKSSPTGWKSTIAVDSGAPASVATKANPVCQDLTANVGRHFSKVQSLIVDIAKSTSKPPTSVYGAVTRLLGYGDDTTAIDQKNEKITAERKSIIQLNLMLASLHCDPVDLEHNGSQKAAQMPEPLQPPPPPAMIDPIP